MYLERLNAPSLESNYYKPFGDFNTSPPNDENQMPNCTMYCYCRAFESCRATEPFPIARNRLGFNHAKQWYGLSPLPKGSEIRTGSIACFDGNYGHVAFVERRVDNTHALISESQYDDNKSLRNYKFWQKRIVELQVGKATLSGIGALQGFLYLPINDIRIDMGDIEIIDDYVNVRASPRGAVLIKGCYCPRGYYKVLERDFVDGYYWYKIDENSWVREGEWLRVMDEITLLKEENEMLKGRLKEIERLCKYE